MFEFSYFTPTRVVFGKDAECRAGEMAREAGARHALLVYGGGHALASGLVERIRAEEGNLCYSYFIPMDDPETVLLLDAWSDQAALDAHHASPVMGEIARLRDRYDLHMRDERCVMEEDVPESDQAFLRK